jgi:hypothetical protein
MEPGPRGQGGTSKHRHFGDEWSLDEPEPRGGTVEHIVQL